MGAYSQSDHERLPGYDKHQFMQVHTTFINLHC